MKESASKPDVTTKRVILSSLLAAYFESWLDYGFIGAKIAFQRGERFSPNPMVYYRGITAFQASLIPATVIQKFANEKAQALGPASASVLSGSLSSLIATPVEQVILTQQKLQASPRTAIEHLVKHYGARRMWVGTIPTAAREIGCSYSVWYGNKALLPAFSNNQLHACIASGAIAAILTHPFDTVGTVMQNSSTKIGAIEASSAIWRKNKIKGFFPGVLPRTASIIGANYWLPHLYNIFSGDTNKLPVSAELYSATAGAVIGMTETTINHPLWTIKSRQQCGYPFTLKPSVLYKGVWPNMGCAIVMDAWQVALGHKLEDLLLKDRENKNDIMLIIGFLSGASTFLISTPVEMVTVVAQRDSAKTFSIAKKILLSNQYSNFYMGSLAVAISNGIFGCAFYAAMPSLRQAFSKKNQNDFVATSYAALLAGLLATYLSNPFDMIKTTQQASRRKLTFSESARNIYSSDGLSGFFKASKTRAARTVSAVGIMGYMKDELEKKYHEKLR